jgi:hypothetical protein
MPNKRPKGMKTRNRGELNLTPNQIAERRLNSIMRSIRQEWEISK